MHELSIAMNVLDIAAEESARRGGVAVQAIHMRLGSMSGVVKEALESAFQLARESSPFADCQLVIKKVPVTIYCTVCVAERPVESVQRMLCSQCQTPSSAIVKGRELEITAMEIDEPDSTDCAAVLGREA